MGFFAESSAADILKKVFDADNKLSDANNNIP
jgi:hypothetical protein